MSKSKAEEARPTGWVRRALRRVALGLLALGLIGGVVGYLWYRGAVEDLPSDLSALREFRPPTACTIYAADGTLIDRFYLEKRVWVPLEDLPPVVWQAFVASEDRRFFQHKGVDGRAIVRAVEANVRGDSTQGGSTITQQLVKNLIVGNERTYRRKVREATVARRLERTLSKREILELYLNYIYLGGGNYGVEAAAQDYYGISARELDAGQAAQLAGIVPSPNRSSPRTNPKAAERRRLAALSAMREVGYLSEIDRAYFARVRPLLRLSSQQHDGLGAAFATEVRRELRRVFGAGRPGVEGFKVYTPLDLGLQEVAEEAVRGALRDHLERQGLRAVVASLEPDERAAFLARGPSLGRDERSGAMVAPAPGQCFRALVPDDGDLGRLRAGSWEYSMRPADRSLMVGGAEEPRPLDAVVRPGDVIPVCAQAEGRVTVNRRPWAEGAAVVIDHRTGDVVALVGGYHDRVEGFVRATQALRQPGSSFKPYVYAAALQGDRHQLDRISNGPINLGGWKPGNYDGKFTGPVSLRVALARSFNMPAVRLTMDVGAGEVRRVARALGVSAPLHDDITLSLGSAEVTPLDQALGYSALVRGGRTLAPVYISRVDDVNGAVLVAAGGEIKGADGRLARLPPYAPAPPAIDPAVAYQVADMMREVVQSGTARRLAVAGVDRGGKTGTTNDFVDAWFIGFTATHTIAVWIGTDGTTSLGDGETGGRAALPVWKRIADALPAPRGQRIPVPDEAVLVDVGGTMMGFPRGKVPQGALPRTSVTSGPLPPFR